MAKADRTMYLPPAISKDLLPSVETVPLVLGKKARTAGVCLSSSGLGMSLARHTHVRTHTYTYTNNKYKSISETSETCIFAFLFRLDKTTAFFAECPEMAELASTDEQSSTVT